MSLPKSAPKRVGRYRLLAPIARGGAATVYLGRSEGIGGFQRIVAVKLLHPHLLEDAASQAANEFIEEAKLSARMQHPMIVPVMDVGQSEDGFYLVMDYVDGASLAEIMRLCEDLPERIVLRILSDVLQGLHAAHTAKDEKGRDLGIVHRDFSPQNILVGSDGRSRLTDFGIARATTRAEYTRTGLVKGKVAYMSPEQAEGKPLDARTDVWAAGVVAWELFAGRRMYPRMDPMPMMLRIINDSPPRLSEVKPDIKPALDEVVARALDRKLGKRTTTASDLRNDILAACGGESAMATPEEVGQFVAKLNIKRIEELRAIVQDASESRSVAPPNIPAAPVPSEGTTRVEPGALGGQESGTFATTSSARSAAGATTEMAAKLQRRTGLWTVLLGAAAILAIVGVALIDTWPAPLAEMVKAPEAIDVDSAGTDPQPSVVEETPVEEAAAPEEEEDKTEEEEIPLPGEPEPDPRTEITITAKEPFQSVTIGKRGIVLPSPTMDVTVRLMDSERFEALSIEAVTKNGKKAKAVLPEDEEELELKFEKVPVRPARRPARKPSSKKPTSDLAASPY